MKVLLQNVNRKACWWLFKRLKVWYKMVYNGTGRNCSPLLHSSIIITRTSVSPRSPRYRYLFGVILNKRKIARDESPGSVWWYGMVV